MKFHHLGLITTEKRGEEKWLEGPRLWITDPDKHPFHVEYLRHEPDSPVSGPLRTEPHLGFMVDNLEEASKGLKVILGPCEGRPLRIMFCQTPDGLVVELMQHVDDKDTGANK